MQTLTHRTNNFDFLRLTAAIAVVLSHQFALSGLPEPLVFEYQTLGGYAVMVFFSISGYLIASSWDREPVVEKFLFKRLLRIWPGLACTVVICGIVLGPLVTTLPLKDYFTSSVTRGFFETLFFHVKPFLPGVFPKSPVAYVPNGVLWTIPIEFRCYLYLAVLGLIGILRKRWILMSLLIVVSLWYYGIHDAEAVFHRTHSHIFEIEYATFFFSGAALYYFRDTWYGTKNSLVLAAACCLAGGIAYYFGHKLICAFLVTPSLAVLFGTACTPVVHRFGRFGDLSYGVYIYAFPIQQTVIWLFPGMGYLEHLAIALPLVFFMAALSWHLVEKIALQYKTVRLPVVRNLRLVLRRVVGIGGSREQLRSDSEP